MFNNFLNIHQWLSLSIMIYPTVFTVKQIIFLISYKNVLFLKSLNKFHNLVLVFWQKRNSAELLRLYLSHGDLTQASQLTCELLSAALGRGKEHFGLSHALVATAPPLCLPFNTVDKLLFELSHHKVGPSLVGKSGLE